MSPRTLIRHPSFIGTWYNSNPKALHEQLDSFLKAVPGTGSKEHIRAVIVPHAGYSYSGQTAAYSYSLVDPFRVRRIFILAPLHHLRAHGCLLPECAIYKTQFYDLNVDQEVVKQLASQGTFQMLPSMHDQDEHSAELQLNYIAHVMEGSSFTIIPIYVGRLNDYDKRHYSGILASFLKDPQNLFVISSDFCHYGECFNYDPFNNRSGLDQCIRELDAEATKSIVDLSITKFERHLSYTKNTICGRHPISLLLSLVDHLNKEGWLTGKDVSAKLLYYTRSKAVHVPGDSSVGYAALSLEIFK